MRRVADMETLETLLTWTPFLLEGFGWNVLIAFTAGLIGLAFGVPLAYLMQARMRVVAGVSQKASGVIPSAGAVQLKRYFVWSLGSVRLSAG